MWQCEAGGFSMSSDNVNLYSDPRFFNYYYFLFFN
jgi:hypothetical protein